MTQFALYRQPTLLNFAAHRHLKLARVGDLSMSDGLHACFLALAEFVPAAREYVIVFIKVEVEGALEYQPVVLLGVQADENLFLDAGRWNGRYVPAFIRRYPFSIAKVEGSSSPVVSYDAWWRGFSETEGDPLYLDDGQPAPRLAEALQFIEGFEHEVARTRSLARRLGELGLMRERAANATLADDSKVALNGFFTIDEDKLQALPEAAVLELHRNGGLGLIHAHLHSLNNLQGLVERKSKRLAGALPSAPANDDNADAKALLGRADRTTTKRRQHMSGAN